jgi:hypothetical protein
MQEGRSDRSGSGKYTVEVSLSEIAVTDRCRVLPIDLSPRWRES